MFRLTVVIATLVSFACLAIGQPQTLSPQNGGQATRAVVVRQRVFSDANGGIYRQLTGPQGRRSSIVMDKYGGEPNEPFRMSVGPGIAASMGMLSPEEVAELEPPKSLADQLVTFLNDHDIDGITMISKVGFGGDAGNRWREALEAAEMDAESIPKALELVDSLIAKAQNDAALLTSGTAVKPQPAKPAGKKTAKIPTAVTAKGTTPAAIKASIRNAPTNGAAPVDSTTELNGVGNESKSPVKPTQPIDGSSAVLPTAELPPIGWSAAEVVTPDQLNAGDIVFVYSPYQFVLYQDPMSVSAVLPSPPTFWRMGVVFKVEQDTKRFGLSMDYVQARNMRTVWTVVGFEECLEVRRFGSVPYVLK